MGISFGKCKERKCPRLFFSWGRYWKGVYIHFSHGTLRLFRSDGRWHSDYTKYQDVSACNPLRDGYLGVEDCGADRAPAEKNDAPLTPKELDYLRLLKQVVAFHSAQVPPKFRHLSPFSFERWQAQIDELERRMKHNHAPDSLGVATGQIQGESA